METLAGVPAAAPVRCLVWEAPGKPISIRLPQHVLNRILRDAMRGLAQLPRRGAEIGGVLLGAVQPGSPLTVTIEGAVPVPCQYAFGPSYALSDKDRTAFRDAARHPRAIGYYRSHTRDGLALGGEDLELFSDYFPGPHAIALLVRPHVMRPCVGGFFFRENGQVHAQRSYREFECRPGPAGEEEAPEAKPQAVPPPSPREIPLPSFLNVPAAKAKQPKQPRKPRLHPLWVSWWVQGPLLAGLLAADGFLGFMTAREVGARYTRTSAMRNPYALSLAVLEYGENLHVTWDRKAPAVAAAERGVLAITDGDQNRTMELNPAQLHFGSVIYRRLSGPVKFRLEVFLGPSRSVAETWESKPHPAAP